MLHCTSRLGILSYLYQNRHHIAVAIGLIEEIPIATCSHEYHFSKNLIIQHASEETQERIPENLSPAMEIVLFVHQAITNIPSNDVMEQAQRSLYVEVYYLQPLISIFRPPCNGIFVA